MGAERRIATRKEVDLIHVNDLTSVDNFLVIASQGYIIDASISGILLKINRKDLSQQQDKTNLSLERVHGQKVVLYLPQMNLDLNGTVIRAQHVGKGSFHIAIEFSNDFPDYWRECLIDLLPEPGELE